MSRILAFEKLILTFAEKNHPVNFHDAKIYFPKLSSITYNEYCRQLKETGRYETFYQSVEFPTRTETRKYNRDILHIKLK